MYIYICIYICIYIYTCLIIYTCIYADRCTNSCFFPPKKRNLVAREIDAHGVLVFRSGGSRFTFGMVELRNRTY